MMVVVRLAALGTGAHILLIQSTKIRMHAHHICSIDQCTHKRARTHVATTTIIDLFLNVLRK